MKSILIFLIIVIVVIFILYQNKKEYFETTTQTNTINLGDKNYNTKNNIFVGYSETEAKDLKEQLKKISDFDINKSNLILNNNSDRDIKNISMDGNIINSAQIISLISDNRNIKYYNETETETETENGQGVTLPVLYNHENKKNGEDPPTNLCIEDVCINKKHLSMLNGNNTVKLKVNDNNEDKHVIPIYTYSGGDGGARTSTIIENSNINRSPFQFTFYQLNETIGEDNYKDTDDWKNSTDINELPGYLNYDYDIFDIGFNYKDFKYFALYNAYSKSYIYNTGGLLLRTPKITDECIFDFDGTWNGLHSKFIYHLFANHKSQVSFPLGIRNVKYNTWMVNEKYFQRRRPRRSIAHCTQIAHQNRPHFLGWEEMHLARSIPLSEDNTSDGARKVHIISNQCNKCLSALTSLPTCHFSDNFEIDDPSIYGHNMWEIIPLANTCSEPCKANYGSDVSCNPPLCIAPIEKNVPKKFQCPEDRPICRYYNGEQDGGDWLGHCSKTNDDKNKYNEKVTSGFRYAKPVQKAYKTDYTVSEPTTPTEDQNDDFYSEYTLKLAKNEKGKLYEPDVYSHYHKHGIGLPSTA